MSLVPLLRQIAPVRVVPRGVEIGPGNPMPARDVLGLPRSPEDVRHAPTRLSVKITRGNPGTARAIVAEVGRAVATWRAAAARQGLDASQIDRMAVAFEHEDLRAATKPRPRAGRARR